jgi:hypothetical protein
MRSPVGTVAFVIGSALFSGCFSHHQLASQATPEVQYTLAAAEEQYLEAATERVVFLSDCPRREIKAEAIGHSTEAIWVHGDTLIDQYETISTIGVTACEQRYVFQVLCRNGGSYTQSAGQPACEVVQDGAQAAAVANAQAVAEEERAARSREAVRRRNATSSSSTSRSR